ncbi:MAG: alkaline phosphatase, partial [Rhodothermales bacterium]|nr:alkaline phosphatase [Rhodothermales bacterium]
MRKLAILILILFTGGCSSISTISRGDGDAAADGEFRNVILIIADGAGPAYFTMTRDFDRATGGDGMLVFDEYLTGSVRTYAANSKVTDSASGATAFASGVKTINRYVGMDAGARPVGT